MSPHSLPPVSLEHQDFVLFGEDVYAYSHPVLHHTNGGLFQQADGPLDGSSSYSHYGNGTSVPDQLQQLPDTMINKQFYSAELNPSQPIMVTRAPAYDSETAYSPYHSSTAIPRTMGEAYMDSMVPTPGLLIHPPTFPFSARSISHLTPTASPATSQDGSGYSGSESGSAHNSPYNRPVSIESHLQGFGFDPSFTAVVDPSIISQSPEMRPSSLGSPGYESLRSPTTLVGSNPGSPRLSRHLSNGDRLSPSYRTHPYNIPRRQSTTSSYGSARTSPKMPEFSEYQEASFYYNEPAKSSRPGSSTGSNPSGNTGKEGKDTLCPECNRCFRDLRAHQLTHQLERPEKCPIATCEYSKKGFARKYDCQRHTLTHYKGNMVCGFCPGSGSALEKSFNRADVFKRHLMAVHNVEQQPPNGRQKKGSSGGKPKASSSSSPTTSPSPAEAFSASGKCSTCYLTFSTAQKFYEHLDECVLQKVVEEEPVAIHNEANLAQVSEAEIASLFSKTASQPNPTDAINSDDEDADGEPDDDETDATFPHKPSKPSHRATTSSSSKSSR